MPGFLPLTTKVWDPSASPVYVFVGVQPLVDTPSSTHVYVTPETTLQLKAALLDALGLAGVPVSEIGSRGLGAADAGAAPARPRTTTAAATAATGRMRMTERTAGSSEKHHAEPATLASGGAPPHETLIVRNLAG